MKKLVTFLAAAALLCGGAAAANLPQLKDANKEKLDKLIGPGFLKKAGRVPRVLVFYRCEGFCHGDAIVTANEAFRVAAAKTGAFTVDFSDDYAALTAANLARYDVLVMNNTTNLKVQEHPYLADALTSFTASGKGYVALHSGVDTFGDCAQLSDLTNGLFGGHPWGAGGTWAFKLADAKHPINAAFADTPAFKTSDEIYQHRAPAWCPAKIHVLVALDFSDPETANRDGKIRSTDSVYPVSWIKPYGKGRVFYTTFGHDDRAWVDPKRLRHMFDGYLYCAGQLKCDDSQPGIDVAEIKKLDSFQKVEAELRMVLSAGGALQKDTVAKIRQILKDPSASEAVKEGCRKALRGFGAPNVEQPHSDAASPAMKKVAAAVAAMEKSPANFAKLVKDPDQGVRLAAVMNAGKVPAKELAAAYAGADARVQGAILARLAAKNAPEGAPLANAALAAEDEDLAVAAAAALRTVGTAADVPALVKALARNGRVQRNAEAALKDIADPKATVRLFELAAEDRGLLRICARRADSAQLALWKPFLKNADTGVRKAAWRELSRTLTVKNLVPAVGWLAADFRDDEVSSAASALKAAAKFAEQDELDAVLGGAWKGASAPARRVLAQTMGLHPSDALAAPLLAALKDGDAEVRKAAAAALGNWEKAAQLKPVMAAYRAEKDAGVKSEELNAAFKLAGAPDAGDLRAQCLWLFKAADPADRAEVARFMLRSVGFSALDDLQALFGDAQYGASAKTAFKEVFGQLAAGEGAAGKPLDRAKWKANASRNGHNAARAFDGDDNTRWDSGGPTNAGDWFSLDLGENAFVQELTLDTTKSNGDTPAGADVFVSADGNAWTGPVASCDDKSRGKTSFKVNSPARCLKVVVKGGRPGLFWSIHEISVTSGLSDEALAKLRAIADSIK